MVGSDNLRVLVMLFDRVLMPVACGVMLKVRRGLVLPAQCLRFDGC